MAPSEAHTAVGFVGAALEQFHLARRFLGTGKHGADHNGMSPGHQGLGYIPGKRDASNHPANQASANPISTNMVIEAVHCDTTFTVLKRSMTRLACWTVFSHRASQKHRICCNLF